MHASKPMFEAEVLTGIAPALSVARVVNRMRELGVLISCSGKAGHTLKIRPPLTFGLEHIDFFMDRLSQALRSE